MGNIKLKIDFYSGAIFDYDKAIELDNNYSNAYRNRGIAKMGLGQKDNACLDFHRAVALGDSKASELINKYCN